MAFKQQSFIPADLFKRITGLDLKEAKTLRLYVFQDGWINANFADIAEEKVRVQGYLPAFLKSYSEIYESTEGGGMLSKGVFNYTFQATLSSDHATIGLSPKKLKALLIDTPSESEQLLFTYSISADTSSGFNNVYFTESDLFAFSDEEGIFDVRERYSQILHEEKCTTDTSSISSTKNEANTLPLLHANTSQAMIHMVEANDYFWKNYDPEDPAETAPTKDQVVGWLIDKDYSRTLAEKMDTILRDGRSKPGGRPENT